MVARWIERRFERFIWKFRLISIVPVANRPDWTNTESEKCLLRFDFLEDGECGGDRDFDLRIFSFFLRCESLNFLFSLDFVRSRPLFFFLEPPGENRDF